ncbi:rhomboid family intramembrane serine protease [Granulosicoccus sp.]|nr:rhomboid family intramembrane serine protease [Granulosicoccus sp.]MDB4222296.1 rhomboid family intramembrane serine protease [Granulosicoccus sp.]
MSRLIDSRNVHSIKRDLTGVGIFIALIWIVFALDTFLELENYGLVPRTLSGLTGIVTMPFLHADFKHLLGNSIPLAVTMMLLAGSRANSGAIVTIITLLSGIGLWIFGRTALHIGASGVVFGLIAFHICAGIFEKRLQSVVLSVVVGLLYASTILQGIVPFQPGVSWEGHLIGSIAGAFVALVVSRMLKTSHQSLNRPS